MRLRVLIVLLVMLPAFIGRADNTERPLPERSSFPDKENYDRALRSAWRYDDLRDRAAAELHRLHDEPDFKLPTDDVAVESIRRTLGPGFNVLKTPYFVVISDAPASEARSRVQTLTRTRHQFYRFTDRIEYPAMPHQERLVCILFDSYERYRSFAASYDGVHAPWTGGYYSRGFNRIVLFNDQSSPSYRAAQERIAQAEQQLDELEAEAEIARRSGERTRAAQLEDAAEAQRVQIDAVKRSIKQQLTDVSTSTVVHEAVHMLAFNSGLQDPSQTYPFWLTEGLAASFETTDPTQTFGPEHPYEPREAKYRSLRAAGDAPELVDLVSVSDDELLTADQAAILYPSGYALFSTIARSEPEALRRFLLSFASASHPESPIDQAERFGRFFDPGACGRQLAAR